MMTTVHSGTAVALTLPHHAASLIAATLTPIRSGTMRDILRYEIRILTRKPRTYLVMGVLLFHFFDVNPIRKYRYLVQSPTIPYMPNYIIDLTSSFIIDFASIWVMFIVADIMLKEKNLKMKEILCTKPVRKLTLFLTKFWACFLSISFMIGIIFVIAWISEVYLRSSPDLSIYVRNYVLDVLPMMIFSVSVVILLSMIFRNTKVTYVVYFVFRLADTFFPQLPPEVSIFLRSYSINSYYFSVSLQHQVFMKTELVFISLGFLFLSYVLYSGFFLKDKSGYM